MRRGGPRPARDGGRRPLRGPAARAQATRPVKILFLAANPPDGLILEGQQGVRQRVPAAALAALFGLFAEPQMRTRPGVDAATLVIVPRPQVRGGRRGRCAGTPL